jgi:uncharacterized protein (TIGR03000 family)
MTWPMLKRAWLPSLAAAVLWLANPVAPARADTAGTSNQPVEISVRVPAGATIRFDGNATAQTGTERLFFSPPLRPGRDYTYDVRLRWTDGGRTVEKTRRLTVRAGDQIALDYSVTAPARVRASGYRPAPESGEIPPAAAPVPVYQYVPRYNDVPRYYEVPSSGSDRPHIYNPDNYPPSGGPPGREQGVGGG